MSVTGPAPAVCPDCRNSRLQLGGWMGPTSAAPYPRPCPTCSWEMSERELQNAYAAYLHDAPEAIYNRGINALNNLRITIHPANP